MYGGSGRERKEGNKEKKIKGTCVEEKKMGEKKKKEIWYVCGGEKRGGEKGNAITLFSQ